MCELKAPGLSNVACFEITHNQAIYSLKVDNDNKIVFEVSKLFI